MVAKKAWFALAAAAVALAAAGAALGRDGAAGLLHPRQGAAWGLSSPLVHATPETFRELFGAEEGDLPAELLSKAAAAARKAATAYLADHGVRAADPATGRVPHPDASSYPYFAFFPQLLGAAVPGGAPAMWPNACFGNNSLSVEAADENGTYAVTLSSSSPLGFLCSDLYLLATVSSAKLEVVTAAGQRSVTWSLPANASAAQAWDLETSGLRVFGFEHGALELAENVVTTLALFYDDVVGPGVPPWAAALNVDFLTKYVPFVNPGLVARAAPELVDIPESAIHSGDFFGVMRLDGLDPMLAWAMGSSTGHTTVALREYEPDGPLWVTESTVQDAYWPTGNIQRTPWAQWVNQTLAAGFAVDWVPLGPEARAAFDVDAAWAEFNRTEGLMYGFHNLVFGWLDTRDGNYPCQPPDFRSGCLTWGFVEVLIGLMYGGAAGFGELVFGQALNFRLGTTGLPPAELYQLAAERGLDMHDVVTYPEQDSWQYQTLRYGTEPAVGPSRVCCVWVCAVWKAAGVFGDLADSIQCGEQTNYDIYSLSIFDTQSPRPQACVDADPHNPVCQLDGQYALILNDLNTVQPYAKMHENCPSQGPNYTRPAGC